MRGCGAIIVGVVLTCGCRDREPVKSEPPRTERAAAPSATPPPKLGSANVGTERPQLPPTPGADATFEAQPRDDAWARPTEAEITRRFGKLRGAKLEQAECRQSQCRITVAGTAAAITQTIADLESARGLHGFAQNVLLQTPEKQSDGTLVMRAIATFDR